MENQNTSPETEPTEKDDISAELISKKQEQIEVERKELLNRVASNDIQNTRDRVAFILNNFPEARNSDVDLAWEYWSFFESHKFNKGFINDREQLRSLTKIPSLARMRAKIQNEYNLFLADEQVRRWRGVLKDEIKKESVETKPDGLGLYSVYIDETGKTQDYLSVGSLWVLDAGPALISGHYEIADWKNKQGINFEFHFSELRDKKRVPAFKDFLLKFLALFPTVSFKIIVVNNKGFSDVNSAITDLTYHLIRKGIEHEVATQRAPLPRMLQVWIDEDTKGSDTLKLENIRERLTSQNIEGLYLDTFEALSSTSNFFIQIADLLTGAVNRKLHNPNGTNFKDELADFILSSLGMDMNDIDKQNNQVDNSKVFNLR